MKTETRAAIAALDSAVLVFAAGSGIGSDVVRRATTTPRRSPTSSSAPVTVGGTAASEHLRLREVPGRPDARVISLTNCIPGVNC
jgi:hypothetical protein